MNLLLKQKISTKLIISFLIVALLAGIVGFFGLTGMSSMMERHKKMYLNNFIGLEHLATINSAILTARGDIRSAIDTKLSAKRSKFIKSIRTNSKIADNAASLYAQKELNGEYKILFDEFQQNWGEYKNIREEVIRLILSFSDEQAQDILSSTAREYLSRSREALDKLINVSVEEAAIIDKEIDSYSSNARLLVFIVMIMSVVTALGLGFFISKLISNPINELVRATQRIIHGEIDVMVEVKTKDETGKLAENFNLMVEKISQHLQYLDILPTPVMLIDTAFNIQYMNKSGAELLGKNRTEIIGQKCYDNFKTGDCKTDKCSCAQAMKHNFIKTEETIANPNGKSLPIIYTGAPLKDKYGKNIGALEYVVDVSEIKNLQNYITNKTKEMLVEMDKFAEGDLTVSLPIGKDDDIGKLFKGFNISVKNFAELIHSVIENVQVAASAATQISASAEQMAAGAQEQSSQANEVASAIEEMTKTIIETSKNAADASKNAKVSSEQANTGVVKIKETKYGMDKITASAEHTGKIIGTLVNKTDQIGEITQVIDDIADQTNLLALNAAIEAARAGEQGRGFAVVADEVRKLAERTTKATKEIAETIRAIQKEAKEADSAMTDASESVASGIELTGQVELVLSRILESVKDVSYQIDRVASASEEQSSASEQITKNVEAINTVTQESASGIQQIAGAAENLNKLTINLQNLVSKFKIDNSKSAFYVRTNGKLITN